MSLLNQLFNRGVFGAKCKTCISLAISRIKLLQNKREVQLNHMRKEIAQFLEIGEEAIARIRVEHIIREMNRWAAYEILELFCEFVLARVPILESQRDCPPELKEAVASIIFAAPRCSDLPELLQIQNLFTVKYGKEFTSAATELRPDTSVNRDIIEKLSVRAPSGEEKLSLLKEIAQQYKLEWDASRTKAEFCKKHEDLLDGSKLTYSQPVGSHLRNTGTSHNSSLSNEAHPVPSRPSTNQNQGIQYLQASPLLTSRTSLVGSDKTEKVVSNDSHGSAGDNIKSSSSEIMERARAAIASAERASAAARAAAELAKTKSGVWMSGRCSNSFGDHLHGLDPTPAASGEPRQKNKEVKV